MAGLNHPFKAEVQAVRDIIKNVNGEITEQIKWAAPSFSYKGYMVTFNLWAKQHVHLVFHNGAILSNESGLLEGDYPDRRMAYFRSMAEVQAKRPALENAVREWVRLRNREGITMKAEQPDQQESDFPAKLSMPARRALLGAGYTRLEQLAGTTEGKLKQLHGMGPRGVDQLRNELALRGLRFAEDTKG
jgi:hypothetical protein